MLLRTPSIKQIVLATGILLAPFILNKIVFAPTPAIDDQAMPSGDICIVAPVTPFDPQWGINLLAPRKIPNNARCPVCGMYPARTSTWAAQVIFKNGDTHFFDSPLTLFVYLLTPEKYSGGRHANDIAVSYVTDMAHGLWIKTSDAYFVIDSDAMGPMRAGNFVAFASIDDAQNFTEKRGGTIIKTDKITPQSLQKLHQSRQHKHLTAAP